MKQKRELLENMGATQTLMAAIAGFSAAELFGTKKLKLKYTVQGKRIISKGTFNTNVVKLVKEAVVHCEKNKARNEKFYAAGNYFFPYFFRKIAKLYLNKYAAVVQYMLDLEKTKGRCEVMLTDSVKHIPTRAKTDINNTLQGMVVNYQDKIKELADTLHSCESTTLQLNKKNEDLMKEFTPAFLDRLEDRISGYFRLVLLSGAEIKSFNQILHNFLMSFNLDEDFQYDPDEFRDAKKAIEEALERGEEPDEFDLEFEFECLFLYGDDDYGESMGSHQLFLNILQGYHDLIKIDTSWVPISSTLGEDDKNILKIYFNKLRKKYTLGSKSQSSKKQG